MALLNVNNMNISVSVPGGEKSLVRNVSFSLDEGEILGLVGSSGSGKSLTSMSIAHILNDSYRIVTDGVLFNGKRLDLMSEQELSDIRGKEIAYVFQEPMTSLNPLLTIRDQVEEPLIIHKIPFENREERLRAVKVALSDAGLEPTEHLLKSYPHELSGGQRQRVMIAMAFICNPAILVADEITTALDTDTTNVIAELLLERRRKCRTSIIFISHDRKLVERIADRMLFMKNGELEQVENESDIKARNAAAGSVLLSSDGEDKGIHGRRPILTVRGLDFSYVSRTVLGRETRKPVLKNVNFELYEGETLGIIGKSGSGKSTLVKTITGLQKAENGSVVYAEGFEAPQMVFQDPYSSLNRSKRVGKILLESLKLGYRRQKRAGIPVNKLSRADARRQVFDAIKSVDLKSEMAYRMLSELSGGERQRVAIACALITRPKIVILDEPVSAVDKAVQGQILTLLHRLKTENSCSYIFISHDPEVIEKTCDRVLVLENGGLKEKRQ